MNIAIAMAIGFVGTSVIHMSKGMMKLGISRMRAPRGSDDGTRRVSILYLAGMIANFTTPFWVMLANLFAPTVFYTSMYGTGLVALLLFSRCVMKEELNGRHYLGAAVIIVGTGVLGAGEIVGTPAALNWDQFGALLVVVGVWVTGTLVAALVTRGGRITLQEVVFGVAAGGLAALDALLKGIAQRGAGGATFIPATTEGIVLLLGSFVIAAGAFGMIQWSYLRHCRASVMGTIYDIAYVGLPVALFALLRPDHGVTVFNAGGLLTLIIGATLIQTAPAVNRALTAAPTRHSVHGVSDGGAAPFR